MSGAEYQNLSPKISRNRLSAADANIRINFFYEILVAGADDVC
jgi:hypothetical protein